MFEKSFWVSVNQNTYIISQKLKKMKYSMLHNATCVIRENHSDKQITYAGSGSVWPKRIPASTQWNHHTMETTLTALFPLDLYWLLLPNLLLIIKSEQSLNVEFPYE